jgi:hypothetical protein
MFNLERTVRKYGAADRANAKTSPRVSARAYRLASYRDSICELSMRALNSEEAFTLQNTDCDATGSAQKCVSRIPRNLGPQPTFSRNPSSRSICSQLGKSLGAHRCRKMLHRNTPRHGKRRTREKEIGLRSPMGSLSNCPEASWLARIAAAERISSQVYQYPVHRRCSHSTYGLLWFETLVLSSETNCLPAAVSLTSFPITISFAVSALS